MSFVGKEARDSAGHESQRHASASNAVLAPKDIVPSGAASLEAYKTDRSAPAGAPVQPGGSSSGPVTLTATNNAPGVPVHKEG